jgi:hypothetical protein
MYSAQLCLLNSLPFYCVLTIPSHLRLVSSSNFFHCAYLEAGQTRALDKFSNLILKAVLSSSVRYLPNTFTLISIHRSLA